VKLVTFGSREDWLTYRRKGLGGSDVPAILGLSPWATPLKVWADKCGIADDSPDTYTLRRGHHMERLLWRELEREVVSIEVTPHDLCIAQGEEEWMLYSPDAFVAQRGKTGWTALAEGKSHPRGASDWTEEPPPHVIAQVQYGMVVTGLPRCYVAVDLGTEFRWALVFKDEAWAETNLPILREFWTKVQEQTPPEPTGDDANTLKRIYPREQAGLTVALDGRFLDLRWEMDQLDAQIRTLSERQADLKAQIVAEMKDAECAMLPDGSGWRLRAETRPRMVRDPEGGESSSRVLRAFARKER
jgi:putative phage-type endonuclease